MADWDFILAPTSVQVRFELDEFMILWFDLNMIDSTDYLSGLGEWVSNTTQSMTPEQRLNNRVTLRAIEHYYEDDEYQAEKKDFLEFVAEVGEADPHRLVLSTLHDLREYESYPGDEALMTSEETFVEFFRALMIEKEKTEFFDEVFLRYQYQMLIQPEKLQAMMHDHLKFMWSTYLNPEWDRTRATLQEAVDTFAQLDYSGMSAFEIIEAVTGRNMRGTDKHGNQLGQATAIRFLPSMHLGPYVGFAPAKKDADGNIAEMTLYFRPRPAKNAGLSSPALDRNELLVRLNALSDETRLKMLELLTQHQELCAQDFITRLELSQSSASRHLRQLTASGYVSERRKDVAKCYSLNQDRIDDTITALKTFLKK